MSGSHTTALSSSTCLGQEEAAQGCCAVALTKPLPQHPETLNPPQPKTRASAKGVGGVQEYPAQMTTPSPDTRIMAWGVAGVCGNGVVDKVYGVGEGSDWGGGAGAGWGTGKRGVACLGEECTVRLCISHCRMLTEHWSPPPLNRAARTVQKVFGLCCSAVGLLLFHTQPAPRNAGSECIQQHALPKDLQTTSVNP